MTYNEVSTDMTPAAIEAFERDSRIAGGTTCEQASETETEEETKAREAKEDEDYEFDKEWRLIEGMHGECGV